ncbi:trace amine-associated receptor 9-like [Acropora muricata]|uniref:trace amine-associated receptor 9-like n=1 Tax=Acropora muricata TaxID=159855 RepID=UPI0034E4DA5E
MNISQQTLGNSPTSFSILIALRSDVQIYTQVAALVLICVGSVVGNIFVVGVVICNYKLHYPTYYFICSLASADFLVGAFYIPLFIASTLAQKWQLPVTLCNWHAAFISLSFNASLITLCLVSVDRFLAITDPLRYQTTLTTRRSVFLLLGGWAHSIFWSMAPQMGWGEVVFNPKTCTCRPNWGAKGLSNRMYALCLALFAFTIPVISMVYCYCRIFLVARYHVQSIKQNSVQDCQSSNTSSRRTLETKASKTLLLVLGAFVVSWLPYTLVTMATMVTKGSWDASSSILNAALTLTTVNGCINPMIYAIRDQRFLSGMKRVLHPQASRGPGEFNSYFSTHRSSDTRTKSSSESFALQGNINFAHQAKQRTQEVLERAVGSTSSK